MQAVAEVEFGFYLNNGSKYDGLREIDLEISAVNGTVSDNISSSESKVIFTLSSLGDGSLTARYNGIETAVNFIFPIQTSQLMLKTLCMEMT